MRINSSDVLLTSSQINVRSSSTYEYFHAWNYVTDTTTISAASNQQSTAQKTVKKDIVQLSPLKNPIPSGIAFAPASSCREDPLREIFSEFSGDIRLQIIKDIIELMTGKKIEVLNPKDMTAAEAKDGVPASAQGAGQAKEQHPKPQGWGLDYYFKETHYSKEGTSFSASGAITTADGKAVKFNVSLEMSRESINQSTVSLKAGDALTDPVMIDFSGKGVSFTEAQFSFDLSATGSPKSIHVPGTQCGFLAYDKNGNGIIDDGTELFGPKSGNGFMELAGYDCDHNGWVDENDPAYSQLRIWQKSDEGIDHLTTLKENDVGAIYCGNASTEFALYGQGNDTSMTALLKDTGIWLKENGGAGIIQEVDIVT